LGFDAEGMSMRVRLVTALVLVFCASVSAPVPARAWDVVVSNTAREAPECVSWGAGRLDCFVRLANGHMAWVAYVRGKWSPVQDLGGDLPVSPSCVVRGPGGVNCFVPSAKGVLAEIHLNGAKWSAWSSLGGELALGRASCVALGTDHIACFARGKRGQLMSRSWAGGATWNEWRDLGGNLSGDPECVALSGDRVACFGRGPQAQLVGYLPNDTGSSGMWMNYGGHVEGRPDCRAATATDVACALRGDGDRLYIVRGTAIAGRASGKLVATGDRATSEPSCIVSGGDFTCFVHNQDRRLIRRTIAANGDMSDGRALNDTPELTDVACLSLQSTALACLISDNEHRIQFAVGGDLNGERIAAESGAGVDESPQGDWYLSSLESNASCRVRLYADKDDGEKRLQFEPACEEMVGVERASRWDEDEDLLEFTTPRGRVVARFRLTGSGRWISPSPRVPYMLSRERPETSLNASNDDNGPPPGLRFDQGDARGVVGQWRLVDEDGDRSCGIRLTDWPTGGGNAVVLNGPCPSDFRVAQFWTMERNAVVLAGGDGRLVARFTRQSPGSWEGKNAQGTASYTLTR
jgi:hypothetical protein